MRIYAFSDFHGHQDKFTRARELVRADKPDLVAITGDISNFDFRVSVEFLNSLDKIGVPVLFVPGNMDDTKLLDWKDTEAVRCLHGKAFQHGDLTFIGLGGGPKGSFATPFEYSESEGQRLLEASAQGGTQRRLALIVHAPPKNTKIDVVRVGLHAGSVAVRKFIEERKPLFSVSGHIHEAQGVDRIGDTVVINTGPALAGNYAKIRVGVAVSVAFREF